MLPSPLVSDAFYIVTRFKVYLMDIESQKLQLIRILQTLSTAFKCSITSSKIMIIDGATDISKISLWALDVSDTTIGGMIAKEYPNFNQSSIENPIYFDVLTINDEDLLLAFDSSLWLLEKQCHSEPHVNSCFYGEKQCEEGWSGESCSIPSC